MDKVGTGPLDEKAAAAFLGLGSYRTLQAWRCRRTGPPFIRLGRQIRYLPQDLAAFMTANRVDPQSGTDEAD
jgi:hypothetical protein